uniref:Uncharacterized protein n=1 Tax=Castor canadensis TaxID=51338 RepID=A0A8C0X8W0_CASCN
RMICWLISLMSIETLLLAVPHLSLHIEPQEGSLAGGTWITVIFDGLETDVLYPVNGSQLEIILVSVAEPALPRILCEVSPVFLDLPVVACQTRPLLSEEHGGLYSLEVCSGGQVVGSPNSGLQGSCAFKVVTPKSLLWALTSLNNSQKVYQAAGGCDSIIIMHCFAAPPCILLLLTSLGLKDQHAGSLIWKLINFSLLCP